MQSYEHHVVNESLEMRHPYIQDPFSSDVDPAQVSTIPSQKPLKALSGTDSVMLMMVTFALHTRSRQPYSIE